MRIILVTSEIVSNTAHSGGLANSVSRLAEALADRGHDVVVVGPDFPSKSASRDAFAFEGYPTDSSSGIRLLDVLSLKRFNMSVSALVRARRIARVIATVGRDGPVDIIHYSNLGGVGLFRPLEIPSVIRISSHTPLCRKHGGYDNQSPFAMWQQITLEYAALRRVDGLYAPSAFVASRLAGDLRRPVEVLRTPFFLETQTDDSSLFRQRLQGKQYLVFVGLLNRLKGVPVIAQALPTLLARKPGLHFVFAGKEHAGFAGQTMQDHVQDVVGNFKERVVFLGELPHRRLFPILRNSHGVVLPSLVDNFPNACLEAMALEKVVVGTQGTSFEELLEDGVSGLLCRPDDPASLTGAIERLLAMPEKQRETIGRRAREQVDKYAPENSIPPLVAYFHSVRVRHRLKHSKRGR